MFLFQWKRNPRYVDGGAKWADFTDPLQNLVPDLYLAYVNQLGIISGSGYAFNGKIRFQVKFSKVTLLF